MDTFTFGDNSETADELLNLVILGKKTATSWAAVHGTFGTEVGTKHIVKDGSNRPRVVIETTDLVKFNFSKVSTNIARAEGEGDLSIEYWKEEHERYFKSEGTFSENMEVYCQMFKVVEILKI